MEFGVFSLQGNNISPSRSLKYKKYATDDLRNKFLFWKFFNYQVKYICLYVDGFVNML